MTKAKTDPKAAKTPAKTLAKSGNKPPAKPRKGAATAADGDRPKSPAEWAYDRLVLYIRNFEAQLDQAQEIAMGFAGDEAGVLRIEGIGYFDPDILTFYGRDDEGVRTQLIQHVTQLSVTLRAVPKVSPAADPPLRIGFRLASGWRGGESGDGSA